MSKALVFAVAIAVSGAAFAATPAARKIMQERHHGMEAIGKAMKTANRELQSSSPNLATLRTSAATFRVLSPKVAGWFPAGTGPEAGKTHAKAEIWQRPDEFKQDAKAFELSSIAFRDAVQRGDVPAIRGAFNNLGKTCQDCHKSFRQKV